MNTRSFTRKAIATTTGAVVAFAAGFAYAIPNLQLYIEGATYDASTETWVYTGTDPVRLWTIGNVGAVGTISDVKLSIAYAASSEDPAAAFTLTPSTTGGLGGFTDPSTPGAPTDNGETTDGSAPLLTDGSSLPTHGIYGAGTNWWEFGLGNFTLTDSPIADFITTFPSPHPTALGQINVYEVGVSGLTEGSSVHFDLYDNIQAGNHTRYIFAPFSHDAEGSGGGSTTSGQQQIPEPSSLALFGVGLLAAGFAYRKRRKENV